MVIRPLRSYMSECYACKNKLHPRDAGSMTMRVQSHAPHTHSRLPFSPRTLGWNSVKKSTSLHIRRMAEQPPDPRRRAIQRSLNAQRAEAAVQSTEGGRMSGAVAEDAPGPIGLSPERPHLVRCHLDEACFYSLTPAHPFHWDRIMAAPKADHGTYSMRWFKTVTYHLQHTGGFLRLATERGRVYWLAQNETEHTTPDWKIHFSIDPRGEWTEDIGAAWNILAALFMERCCEAGMKARYTSWGDDSQRGRELTVYVFQHDERYDEGHRGGPMEGLSPEGQFHLHHLG